MQVILKQNVQPLGKAGDTVKVSDGYARNFLIPRGLAMEANFKNLQTLDHEKKKILRKAEKEKRSAEALAETFRGVTCTIRRRVGEQDKLFGSVTSRDIQEALLSQALDVDRKNILLDKPIRELGEFPVRIKLPAGVFADIKVTVTVDA